MCGNLVFCCSYYGFFDVIPCFVFVICFDVVSNVNVYSIRLVFWRGFWSVFGVVSGVVPDVILAWFLACFWLVFGVVSGS